MPNSICWHDQHVRHNPPFINRPWVETVPGRRDKIGSLLDCVRCDRLEFPDDLQSQRRTPEFTYTTLPEGLRKAHTTKVGVWGLLHVTQCELIYILERDEEQTIRVGAGDTAVIVPEMLHRVALKPDAAFFIEFFSKS